MLLDFAGRFNTQLRVCAVRKANRKGRVERAIRWWRQRFLAGRVIRTVDQGNRELTEFLTTTVLDPDGQSAETIVFATPAADEALAKLPARRR